MLNTIRNKKYPYKAATTTTSITVNDTDDTKSTHKMKDNEYLSVSTKQNKKSIAVSKKDLRKFPYPYRAMLAICSDIDDTTLQEFNDYHKFLNTKEQTSHGKGLGLDIGDSMWLYTANNENYKIDKAGNGIDNTMTFYYRIDKSKKHNSEEIIKYCKSGWIDSLHTFGDFSRTNEMNIAFNRNYAINGWDTLKSINFSPKVWINHGNRANEQNFGAHNTSKFMSYQEGDTPKSPYYHTDLTIKNGIRFVWNSIGDTQFGYNYPIFQLSLRDGQNVWGFHRYTNEIKDNKIDWTWTPKYIHKQITKERLENIVKNNQYSIVGQHLGVSPEDLYTSENIQSLKMLKQYEDDGKILVAKTSRLLNYADVNNFVSFNEIEDSGKTSINIKSIDDPIFGSKKPSLDDIRGLTFYTNTPENTTILLNKVPIDSNEISVNPKDETSRPSVSIKWFTPNYTDYTVK